MEKKSNKIQAIVKQFLSFFVVSGIGWCLDFATYVICTSFFNLQVSISNMISAIPAITWVFIISNKKIFKNQASHLDIKYKYIIYFSYQLILVTLVSSFGEMLYSELKVINFINNSFLINYLKIIVKILITPITMILNFIVMKNLIEKI